MNKKPASSLIIGEIERYCRRHKAAVKILRVDWKGYVCKRMVLLVCQNAFPVKGFPKIECKEKCIYAFGAQAVGQLAIDMGKPALTQMEQFH
ncbi:MAG: hypothetical protein OEZ25_01845 [Candidatus Bathyarchaeota archaeon]|nr:hypothetical protein [Candidatus Bathyarchaeota archaeon]